MPFPLSAERGGTSDVSTYRFNSDYAATNNLLVHAGAGYTRYINADSSPASVYTYDTAGKLGLPGAVGLGFPHFGGFNTAYGGIVNGSGNGLGPTQENLYWMDHANGIANAIWTHRSHAIKVGAEYKNDMWVVKSQVNQSGSYNFSGNETAIPYNNSATWGSTGNTGTIGFPYASFLLGQVDGGTLGNAVINQYHRPTWALYLQDTWKATSRLTVDYGVRWDFTQTTHEHGFHTSGFSPTAINENAVGPNGPLLGGMQFEGFGPGKCNCYFMPHDPYSIGPRLGVAYQVNPKTVVRGGVGITYGQAFPFDYAGSNFAVVSVGYNTLNFSLQRLSVRSFSNHQRSSRSRRKLLLVHQQLTFTVFRPSWEYASQGIQLHRYGAARDQRKYGSGSLVRWKPRNPSDLGRPGKSRSGAAQCAFSKAVGELWP